LGLSGAELEWSVKVEAIDRARILQGWTRRDLARQAHVDEGTLCVLLSRRRRPSFGVLRGGISLDAVIEFGDAT
jgi:hypothetical protein